MILSVFDGFQDGTFLVRESRLKEAHHPYSMGVLHLGSVYHLKIRLRSDKQYALGEEKDNEPVGGHYSFKRSTLYGKIYQC